MPILGLRHGSRATSDPKGDPSKTRSGQQKLRPTKVATGDGQWAALDDGQISPGSNRPGVSTGRGAIAPWESMDTVQSSNEHNYFSNQAATPRNKPSKSPDSSMDPPDEFGGITASDGSFQPTAKSERDLYRDTTSSPHRRPSFDRRPSANSFASSSTSTDRPLVAQKKLQGWFGEDDLSKDLRHLSQSSLQPVNFGGDNVEDLPRPPFGRQGSHTNVTGRALNSRQQSPGPSRPRTPQPSSDVTPWMYQDERDIDYFGDAPVRETPSDMARLERSQTQDSTKTPSTSGRFHLHRHRHNKSHDERANDSTPDNYSLTPAPTRTETFPSLRRNTTTHSKTSNGTARQTSPSPPPLEHRETFDGASARSPPDSSQAQKRSLFDRFRSRNKSDRQAPSDLPRTDSHGSVRSYSQTQPSKESTNGRDPGAATGGPLERRPTKQQRQATTSDASQNAPKKEHHTRLPFKTRRTATAEVVPPAKDPNQLQPEANDNDNLWNLDTDLGNMEGIVQPPPAVASDADALNQKGGTLVPEPAPTMSTGVWDAPDSWAVKKHGEENEDKLHELDEDQSTSDAEDASTPHSLRLFRPDGTFATIAATLGTTAAELVSIMGRKSFAQDDVNRFHIIMQKNETSRQLDPGERPLAIQKRLLEQAGYNDSDHLEEIGRDDHSYLCRFSFVPAKMLGYSTLDKDLALNTKQKFSAMDLTGRNINTIPIALYQKSSEIVFLNLSRNLNLDVPKDFIQSCSSLREIRYTGNEASRVPISFSLASRLTVLDISNNRLEQLEHAELEKLPNLASLKVSNNRLKAIPQQFDRFQNLRSLNLSSNFLTELPACICDLKTLVDLDISFNSIESLPHIGGLERLERLWATNNKLCGRPEDTTANLKNLREVDIRFNVMGNIDVLSMLPQLEHLMAGHNSITAFEGSFAKIRTLYLDHNPVTRFDLGEAVPTLTTLSLASAKLAQLPDDLFPKMSGLVKLILTKNHFAALTPQIGKMLKLDHLSIAKNSLSTLPAEIGRLTELRFLDVRENNINLLPPEIWLCRKLETFNVSSNVLDSFPKPPTQQSLAGLETSSGTTTPSITQTSPITEEGDNLGEWGPPTRRPSQASGYLSSTGSSPGSTHRKGSVASIYNVPPGRKPSMMSRANTELSMSPISRKDSLLVTRMTSTFAGSLRQLFLADNRLEDTVFDQLIGLQELRVLNLSYNDLYDIPSRTIRRFQHLAELYVSGNDLTSLPSEDLEDCSSLRVIHINANKFQVLPAELGKITKLAVLDASSNALKYNVTNWPYDWNWNWNRSLKYLNLSGNKRLEIKPSRAYSANNEGQNLTDFGTLQSLRVLGLMDVTLMTSVPDQTEDRRVRTSGSFVGTMAYGISDCLGNNEHLSTIDIVVPKLEGHDDETLFGLFDGVPLANGGSKIVKYLQENFERQLKEELKRTTPEENAMHALRRTYITLNKELATWANQSRETKERRVRQGSVTSSTLTPDDLKSGCVATVLYLHGMDLFVSNVGNAEAVLIQSEGSHRIITKKHDPADPAERLRIRDAGGYVSRQGKLNDAVDISRAFGFVQLIPAVVAAPYCCQIQIQESDELILLASRELWDYLTVDFAVDLARSERGDLMRAAQKLRDLAIAFGASSKITVMLVGVSDLRRKERARYRTHSMSMGPSGVPDDYMTSRRGKRGRDATLDSKLARLDQEVEAPVGEVSLVFTDIKNSTHLWQRYEKAMRSAIKMHNEVMRRHLRLIGGYEVKTEGDAFMVAFPTVTSALLWCFTIQSQLLEVQWPQEILNSVDGQEVTDSDGNVLFRGLSVRMGIHWGEPVCETDPVTRRMDYFGPMVNKAARISGVADGGQITVSSDFIAEVQRLLETHIEADGSNSTGSEEDVSDDALTLAIRRELRSLSSHGFEVKDLGEKRLKGLENPEIIYLMYPHSLSGRLAVQQQRADAEKASQEGAGAKSKDSQLTIDVDNVWDLWSVSLRLEMLCSWLESSEVDELKPPETALLERTRERGGEVTDRFLVNFVEHQISRIETCITSLELRNLVRPFSNGMMETSGPMMEIFSELSGKLQELATLKQQIDFDIAPS